MDYETLRSDYNARYNNDQYKSDAEHMAMLGMISSAGNMSAPARQQFAVAFDFDFALDGVVYVGGEKSAMLNYPDLMAEANSNGIKIKIRGK